MKNEEKFITIMIQSLYGNRTLTRIPESKIDMYILGYLDTKIFEKDKDYVKIDRTVIKIPNTENLVLVYNKIKDEENKKRNINVSAKIPELDLVLNSRCLICRMNDDGSFDSIREEDIETAYKYLVE